MVTSGLFSEQSGSDVAAGGPLTVEIIAFALIEFQYHRLIGDFRIDQVQD